MIKNKLFIFFLALSTNLYPGPDCLSKSKNLREDFDYKEWHTPCCQCNCKKEVIKGGKCIQCEHLQNPHPLIVVETYDSSSSLKREPLRPKKALELLVQKYQQNNLLSANKKRTHIIK